MSVVRMCPRHRTLSTGRCPRCVLDRQSRQRMHTSTTGRAFRLAVLARDGYRCHWCGERADTMDYVVALVDGGRAHDLGNAVAACRPCNSKRGAAITNGVQGGMGVDRERSDPAKQPATFPRVKFVEPGGPRSKTEFA